MGLSEHKHIQHDPAGQALPIGGGEMGARIRAYEWSESPLGPPATWPQSLHSALSICLHSTFPTAIYWGPELRLLYNDAWAPVPAERHPWALGRPAREVWSDIWDIVGPQFARVLDTGEGFAAFDQMLPMERGGRIELTWWNYSFTPIRGEDGRVVGVFNQGNETTAKVLDERRLRFRVEMEERLQALADPTETMSAMAEVLGRHLDAGRVFYGEVEPNCEYLNVVRDWTDGTMASFVGLHRLDGFGKTVIDELRAGRSVRINDAEVDPRMHDGAGAYRAAHLRAAVVVPLFKDGRLLAILSAHTRTPRRWTHADIAIITEAAQRTWDAVERARAEAALRRLNAELEKRIEVATAERTAALSRLHEAQKLETLGQLTGGIAHDFNNLLTPVIGALDIICRRHAEDRRTLRLTSGALEAAERAKTLVQRLLAFARRQDLELRPIDVGALVRGMMELIARSIGPQIEVVLDAPEDLPSACSDANQLELALLNLALNARDAMSGKGTLTIAARLERVGEQHRSGLKPGEFVRISVSDTGIGMDAETLRRSIEPFFSTKGVGHGTGLGLSLVHGLAGQSGGALLLSSATGEGTTVELWLPVVCSAPHAARQLDAIAHTRTKSLAVLLVDDEDLVRSGIAEMLADLGHTVIQSSSAAGALDALRARTPVDLLITDYLMRGTNGLELADAVRALRPGLPIILISGYANVSAEALGDLPRLSKPFKTADLARVIAEVSDASLQAS